MSYARESNFYLNPALAYGRMYPGQDRGAAIPGWGMNPYWAGPAMVGVGGYGAADAVTYLPPASSTAENPMPTWVKIALGGVAIVGVYMLYQKMKIMQTIAAREGSA